MVYELNFWQIYISEFNVHFEFQDPYKPNYIIVPGDHDGIRTDVLRDKLREAKEKPKLIYLNPTGANPTGTIISESRRREICMTIFRNISFTYVQSLNFRFSFHEKRWLGIRTWHPYPRGNFRRKFFHLKIFLETFVYFRTIHISSCNTEITDLQAFCLWYIIQTILCHRWIFNLLLFLSILGCGR